MQLKRAVRPHRRKELAAATLGLLGVAAPQAQAASATDQGWTIDAGLLYYAEDRGRIKTTEPQYNATFSPDSDHQFSGKIVLDAVSGATPNGAAPAPSPQSFQGQSPAMTVTGPSGSSSTSGGPYTVPAGELPLAPGFKDDRLAIDLGYELPLLDNDKAKAGITGSIEHDFRTLGANLLDSVDLAQKNTQLAAGVNLESDELKPATGFVPLPRSQQAGFTEAGTPATASRQQLDALVGITQVVTDESLAQLTYSRSIVHGDLTDPYRIISVVDSSGNPTEYQYESRPEARKMQALFGQCRWMTTRRQILNATYRYTSDDWGIHSQTADLTYRWLTRDGVYAEPHLRAYRQSAAAFYRVALSTAEGAAPGYASSDARLGRFDAVTLGVKVGAPLQAGSQVSLRLERYQQFDKVTGVPSDAAAALSGLDLAQNLSATWVTVSFSY